MDTAAFGVGVRTGPDGLSVTLLAAALTAIMAAVLPSVSDLVDEHYGRWRFVLAGAVGIAFWVAMLILGYTLLWLLEAHEQSLRRRGRWDDTWIGGRRRADALVEEIDHGLSPRAFIVRLTTSAADVPAIRRAFRRRFDAHRDLSGAVGEAREARAGAGLRGDGAAWGVAGVVLPLGVAGASAWLMDPEGVAFMISMAAFFTVLLGVRAPLSHHVVDPGGVRWWVLGRGEAELPWSEVVLEIELVTPRLARVKLIRDDGLVRHCVMSADSVAYALDRIVEARGCWPIENDRDDGSNPIRAC